MNIEKNVLDSWVWFNPILPESDRTKGTFSIVGADYFIQYTTRPWNRRRYVNLKRYFKRMRAWGKSLRNPKIIGILVERPLTIEVPMLISEV